MILTTIVCLHFFGGFFFFVCLKLLAIFKCTVCVNNI